MPFIGELGEAGIAKEPAVGTVTPPVRYRRFIPPFNFSTDIALLEGKGVTGVADLIRKTAQGAASLKGGKMKYELDLEEVGDDLGASMGTDTPTEVASYIVSSGAGENDKLDCVVDGGAPFVVTIAAGTYKMGTSSAQAGTLCALLKAGLEAGSAGRTFTVTFSYSTMKMTIAIDAAHTIQILWLTGTNNAKGMYALLGWTKADTSASLNITSDSTAPAFVMSHVFSRVQSAELLSYTWWQKTGLDYPQHAGCMLSKLEFDIKAKEFVIVDADWLGLKYDATGVTQSATYSSRQPIKFDMCIPTVGGSPITNYDELKVTIDNMVDVQHVVGSTIYGAKIYSKGLRVSISMSMIVEDTTEWAKFIAGTVSSFSLAMTSTELIKAGFPYSLTLAVPNIAYSAAPRPLSAGLIKITFVAVGVYNGTYTILPTLVNGFATAYTA